jgi:hypothetical protein
MADAATLWDIASANYARYSVGEVNVFSEGGTRAGDWGLRTWPRSERPILTGSTPGWMLGRGADALYSYPLNRNISRILERDNNGEVTGVDFSNPFNVGRAEQYSVLPGGSFPNPSRFGSVLPDDDFASPQGVPMTSFEAPGRSERNTFTKDWNQLPFFGSPEIP